MKQYKMENGVASSAPIKNAGTARKDTGNVPKPIANAAGMCDVGGQGFAKIKGAVS